MSGLNYGGIPIVRASGMALPDVRMVSLNAPPAGAASASMYVGSAGLLMPFDPAAIPTRKTEPVVCRCGGDGVSAGASPRAAAMAREELHMVRAPTASPFASYPPDAKVGPRPWRARASPDHAYTGTTFAGPLADLIPMAELRLDQGYEIKCGDVPDRSLLCERCEGSGREPTYQEDPF